MHYHHNLSWHLTEKGSLCAEYQAKQAVCIIIAVTLHDNPVSSHYTDEDTEAHIRKVSCPRSHSC